MEAQIVVRVVARLAEDRLRLRAATRRHAHDSAERRAVRRRAFELHLEPAVRPGVVVSEQRRRLVHVEHQDVDVAVVVDVAERGAAARVRRHRPRAAHERRLLEARAVHVPEDDARAAMRVLRQQRFDFRVDIAGDVHEVGASVVVEVGHARAPLDVAIHHADAGGDGDVFEQALAEIPVQARECRRRNAS